MWEATGRRGDAETKPSANPKRPALRVALERITRVNAASRQFPTDWLAVSLQPRMRKPEATKTTLGRFASYENSSSHRHSSRVRDLDRDVHARLAVARSRARR